MLQPEGFAGALPIIILFPQSCFFLPVLIGVPDSHSVILQLLLIGSDDCATLLKLSAVTK